MKIKINGKEQEVSAANLSITELLKIAKVESAEMVSVQLNGRFVDKADTDKTLVKDKDEVDFLYFMGGGELL